MDSASKKMEKGKGISKMEQDTSPWNCVCGSCTHCEHHCEYEEQRNELEANNSQAGNGYRRVIITAEDLARDNILLPPMPPLRLIVSFKELEITEPAINWMNTYSQQQTLKCALHIARARGFM
jgi:hypothetical protein